MENNSSQYPERPTRFSYLVDNNFWAGEYPIDKDPKKAQVKLDAIVGYGITDFIDLTEEGELNPYQGMLPPTVSYTRFPIRDCSVPTTFEQMDQTLEKIQEVLSEPNRKVYLHCWGGVGRTGTVIACYFISKGKSAPDALRALRECFDMNEKSRTRTIPETFSQLDYIHQYDQRLNGRQ